MPTARTAILLCLALPLGACGAGAATAEREGPTVLARAGSTLLAVEAASGHVRRLPAGAHDLRWEAIYSARATARATTVTATDPATGRKLRSTEIGGHWTIPIAAGTTPEGSVSGDGRWLVLKGTAGDRVSEFALLRTTLDSDARRYRLKGRFDFDALAPDGSAIYLSQIERGGRYVVRAFDVRKRELRPQVIVEKTSIGTVMQGIPVARAVDPSGAPVHTLYRGGPAGAFVHSLDTARGAALCILIPRSREAGARWRLRLGDDPAELHAVNEDLGAHYVIDPFSGEVADAPAGTELPGTRLGGYAVTEDGAVAAGARRIATVGDGAELLAVR